MTKSKIRICKHKGCYDGATTLGYCRLHYLKNWRKIKEQQRKKAVKNLNKYIEHLCKTRPDGYVEAMKGELKNEFVFEEKVQSYVLDDEYRDIMDELDISHDVDAILGDLKVDKGF